MAEIAKNRLPEDGFLSAVLPLGGYVTIQCEAYFDESASHDDAPILKGHGR